jgi:two-component system, OmpR family, sensor kinase
MRHPRGIRSRLLSVVVVALAVALALMTLGFNLLLARNLSHDAEALLRSRAAAEAGEIEVVNDRVMVPGQPSSGGLESQVWVLHDGRVLQRPNTSAALDRAAAAAALKRGVSVEVPDLDVRLYAMATRDPATVVVAGVSVAPYERTQQIALVGSLTLAAVLLLVVSLVARWMLRAALRPVTRMTADAESWSEHDPDRRFAVGEPYDEISQLGATLDRLLDRLAASLRREQRFSAEVSHELRTPLAKIRVESEIALRRDRAPAEYRETLETVVDHAREMTSIIETLVAAEQSESGLARGRCDALDVLKSLADSVGEGRNDHGQVELDVSGARLMLGVDADTAARILQPVIENATRLAASTIRLAAVRAAGGVVVHVDDDGPGVREVECERIFEPGVRGTAAEGDGHNGAGLGLALARRLARAAGGDIGVRPAPDGGHFTVWFPGG